MSNNTKLFCLFLKAQKIDKSSEQGYSMVVVSILTIIMFSLLATSLIFSNLAKSRTDAFVDGQSSFAVAEAGLNKRGVEVRKKLDTYSGVDGVIDPTGPQGLASCFSVGIPAGVDKSVASGTNDFECRNYRFRSSNNISTVAAGENISLDAGGQSQNTYVAYTLVADRTRYNGGAPQFISIPTGDDFAGLNAAEYNYVIHSTGKKPVTLPVSSTLPSYTPDEKAAINRQKQGKYPEALDAGLITAANTKKDAAVVAGTAAATEGKSSNNTTLSMTFTNRVVPLFQFGIFYEGDLELNSTSPMQIRGWVHSNANIYVQPAGVAGLESQSVTTFLANVSASGSIYNRVDAWVPGIGRTGITRVLLTGADCATGTCQDVPAYAAATTIPLTPTQISAFPNRRVQDGITQLKTPSPGFTRKRNYDTDRIGKYYSQADIRLEMLPDRDVTSKVNSPWDRDTTIIPFNFTAITTATTVTDPCTTALPAAGSDPAPTYVDPTREKLSTRNCKIFTKGQLQSLRQPVLVLTSINQTDATLRTTEDTTLGKPTPPTLPAFPTLSAAANTDATKEKIVRALQVALVSTPSPVAYERLGTLFDDPAYTIPTNPLNPFRQGFSYLIGTITTLTADDRDFLLTLSPNQIAALRDAWFLPAPIQRVEKNNADITDAATNLRRSGFYDGREQRWMTMLQTNIASLSVWNRDGLYVNALNNTMTTAYTTDNSNRGLAFNAGAGANFTDGMAFDRPAADPSKPVGSFQRLGLGSNDTTEGGLVVHATVNDDLNGDGTKTATDDIMVDKTDPDERILKKNADNTNFIDPDTGTVVIIDYLRKYPNQIDSKQSPFAFAFNGGNYLPNALLLSSDQAIYVQGNFNNNLHNDLTNQPPNTPNTPSPDRLPAAIVADTITALSNECVSIDPAASNPLGLRLSQLKCGLPPTINGANVIYDSVGSPMAINAAFLSNTQISNGNQGAGRYDGVLANKAYSGGVNNYIRLLEDWENSNNPYALNYTGSLISLGAPLEYSGLYLSGGGPSGVSYYNIPFRNFNYDPNFSNVEKLPPLTPKASYVQQKNFGRAY
jgi:Tfp pilus assembly protein PilX